jgi:L-ascorbate metabolism protein UlaG (beta-lactamase superfamily)
MIRLTYVGHATVLIEAGGTRLLTDPVLRMRVAHLRRIVRLPSLDELREPDAVLITHAHIDHLDPPSLRLLRPCPVVAPRGCGGALERAGLREVIEAAPGEAVRIGDTRVIPFPVVHDGRRHPFSRARGTFAYVVDGPIRALFAGDTDLFDGMGERFGRVDAALLPIWGWGPRVGRGHMDPARAARAVALVAPSVAIPIHWGTLASPRAPWRDDPARPARAFEREVAALAPEVDVRILQPGTCTEVVRAAVSGQSPSS